MKKNVIFLILILVLSYILIIPVKAETDDTITLTRTLGISHRDMTGYNDIKVQGNKSYYVFIFDDFLLNKFGLDRANNGYYDQPAILYDDATNINGTEMIRQEDLYGSMIEFSIIDNNLYIYFRYYPVDQKIYESDGVLYWIDYSQQVNIPLNSLFNSWGLYLEIEITIPAGNLDYDEIYTAGYEQGKKIGEQIGDASGYSRGYKKGVEYGKSITNAEVNALAAIVPNVVGSIWGVVHDFLNIEVYGVNLWQIVATFSSISILLLAIKLLR